MEKNFLKNCVLGTQSIHFVYKNLLYLKKKHFEKNTNEK